MTDDLGHTTPIIARIFMGGEIKRFSVAEFQKHAESATYTLGGVISDSPGETDVVLFSPQYPSYPFLKIHKDLIGSLDVASEAIPYARSGGEPVGRMWDAEITFKTTAGTSSLVSLVVSLAEQLKVAAASSTAPPCDCGDTGSELTALRTDGGIPPNGQRLPRGWWFCAASNVNHLPAGWVGPFATQAAANASRVTFVNTGSLASQPAFANGTNFLKCSSFG